VQQADVVLPESLTGATVWAGKWKDIPPLRGGKAPVVLFLHGSSGLGLKAIGEWQRWLATLGIASVAPDSFALPGRVTYTSPISKEQYERIHALRLAEVAPALKAITAQPWANMSKLVLAGASEGGVPVARYAGNEFAARMIFAWSCEPNYFVAEPKNALPQDRPVLNLISASDPFFSSANTWLGHAIAKGHCGDALKDNKYSTVTLIPGAPHTLLNVPQARAVTAGFLRDALKPEAR
jgi:dienelactone hydrolase